MFRSCFPATGSGFTRGKKCPGEPGQKRLCSRKADLANASKQFIQETFHQYKPGQKTESLEKHDTFRGFPDLRRSRLSTASGRLKLCEQQLVQTTHKGIGILQGTLFGQESFFVNEFGPLGKGGVIAYTKNLALRVADYGATCNSIDPGGVLTPLNEPVINDPESWQKIMDETPLKRWATVEEIADWAYFMTVVNRFCTGQSIIIDGGEAIKHNFIWKD